MAWIDSGFIRRKSPAFVWAAVIFLLSSIPARSLPKLALLKYDKLIHATVFFIFGMLVYRAVIPSSQPSRIDWRSAITTLIVVIMYGMLDEVHQHFVAGRTPDVYDALADAVGGLLSASLVLGIARVKIWSTPGQV